MSKALWDPRLPSGEGEVSRVADYFVRALLRLQKRPWAAMAGLSLLKTVLP